MKNIAFVFLLGICVQSQSQNNYWQQYLHYTIRATLNDQEKSITGTESIVYKNNSPDTLTYIWFHIYPNAYKDLTTALYMQIANDPTTREKINTSKPGYISNLAFTVNGTPAKTEADSNDRYIDIIKLLLNEPLGPGDSVTIATPFKVQLPSYFSRSGYADGEFIACQWYPKPAVYDKDGWHPMPYLNMGEFYSEYASYNVDITLPSKYVVAATGVLQTAPEAALYKSIGAYNTTHRSPKDTKLYQPPVSTETKTLTYYADSVPDFAWFAEKNLVIEYDTVDLGNGKIVDAYTFYHQRKNTPWDSSIYFVKDAVHHYSNWIGTYAYPVVQAIEGPKNNSSGGMEYPMITLITSPDAKPETLDGVIAHEVGHNWFMSMLGTNERDHPWMDEGLNTYYQFRYEAEKRRSNAVFGSQVPAELKKLNEEDFQAALYNAMMQIPIHPSLGTTSANFTNSEEYGLTAYVKTAEWMYLMERSIGKEKIDRAFQNYFYRWKFKHPDPEDLKAAFEEAINTDLTAYFELLNKEDKLVE